MDIVQIYIYMYIKSQILEVNCLQFRMAPFQSTSHSDFHAVWELQGQW